MSPQNQKKLPSNNLVIPISDIMRFFPKDITVEGMKSKILSLLEQSWKREQVKRQQQSR